MDLFQAPLLVLIKSATIMTDEAFLDIIPIAWELLLDVHKETVAAAAAMFILSAVRCPEPATVLLNGSLRHPDAIERFKALLKYAIHFPPFLQHKVEMTFHQKVPSSLAVEVSSLAPNGGGHRSYF